MERRDDESVDELIYTNLVYIDSLDDGQDKADALHRWCEKYLHDDMKFNLPLEKLKSLDELFYRNMKFLNDYVNDLRSSMRENRTVKKFHKH